MIVLTNLRGEEVLLLPMHIELVDACPDTRLQLTTGKQLYVQQTPKEVADLVVGWYQQLTPTPAQLDRAQSATLPPKSSVQQSTGSFTPSVAPQFPLHSGHS